MFSIATNNFFQGRVFIIVFLYYFYHEACNKNNFIILTNSKKITENFSLISSFCLQKLEDNSAFLNLNILKFSEL